MAVAKAVVMLSMVAPAEAWIIATSPLVLFSNKISNCNWMDIRRVHALIAAASLCIAQRHEEVRRDV